MRHYRIGVLVLPLIFVSAFAFASESNHDKQSKYAGQEKRAIKSLSPEDITELKRGGGWGLAKAAELNGVPGPAHLLEMKNQIPLTKDQVEAITKIYNQMKSEAIKLGNQLIEFEKDLEIRFQKNSVDRETLKQSLTAISQTRNELRFVHLATHLETPKILSPEQIKKYNALRGYSNSDPCENIPSGHNAEMWRKHNGCN
jgi:Spy/CpxP family protein refolding chaperone